MNLEDEQNSSRYYKIVYFFVANQIVFKRLGVVLLILVNIAIWWIAGTGLVTYLASIKDYNEMLDRLVEHQIDWQVYRLQNQQEDLRTISVQAVRAGSNKYDLVASVYNPNSKWHAAEVTYAFVVDDYVLDWQTDFVLPGKEKYLFDFNYFSNSFPENVSLKIGSIKWQRVNDPTCLNVLDSLKIENAVLSSVSGVQEVNFIVKNNGAYSFWQMGWQIVLYQGNIPIGANYVISSNLRAGEEREVSATWTENLGFSARVDVLPDVNVFDETNYITSSETPPVNLIKGAKTSR